MADGNTTNHGFILPEIGLAKNTWGDSLNGNWEALDAILDEGNAGLFIAKTGGTMSAPLLVQAGTEAAPSVQWDNANNGIYWAPGGGPSFTTSGATIGQLRGGTTLAETYSIVTRQAGDNRYLQKSGGTIDGSLSVTGTLNAGTTEDGFLIGHGGANAFLDNTGAGALQFRQNGNIVADFQTDGELVLRRTANGLINWTNGDMYFQKSGVNVARIDNDGGLGAPASIVTRQKGDERYTAKTWSVSSGAGLTGGGNGNANRTISMGTPSDITKDSANSASGNTHTHRILANDFRDMISSWLFAGSIGSFVLAKQFSGGEQTFGDLQAGGQLRPCSTDNDTASGTLTGTWRCMGYLPAGGDPATLFIRIA